MPAKAGVSHWPLAAAAEGLGFAKMHLVGDVLVAAAKGEGRKQHRLQHRLPVAQVPAASAAGISKELSKCRVPGF